MYRPKSSVLMVVSGRVLRFVSIVFAILALFGCVSIDSRASKEVVDKEGTRQVEGTFANRASYHSQLNFVAEDNLSDLLQASAGDADWVRISGNPADSLTMVWLREGKEKAKQVYTPESGLSVDRNGVIEIADKASWVGGEGGYARRNQRVRIFINANGDLVTLQSGGAAGFWGPLPIGLYEKLVAIFPRKCVDACPPIVDSPQPVDED